MDHTAWPRTVEGPLTVEQNKERMKSALRVLKEWTASEDERRATPQTIAPVIKSPTQIAREAQLAEELAVQTDKSGIKLTE